MTQDDSDARRQRQVEDLSDYPVRDVMEYCRLSLRSVMAKPTRTLPPIHPGEILREELMKPLGLSINRVARDLRVTARRSATQIARDVHPIEAA